MKKISTAHWLLFIVAAVQLLLSLGLSALVAFGPADLYIPMWLQLLLSPVSLLAPFVIYCIITKSNPLKLIRFKKVKISSIILALLVMVFCYPVILLLNMVSMMFVDNAMAAVLPSAMSMGLPAAVLLMAVVPAIVEETIFRGCLYNTYSKRRPLAGIFLSALLFGFMHMNFNQMPYAFFLGIILALMLEATDSIVIPMIMHFSLNGFTTVISYGSISTMQNTAVSGQNINEIMTQAYREALAGQSLTEGMSEAQIAQMAKELVPMAMGVMLGILVVIALVALAAVLALVYATFALNGRRPKEILLAKNEEAQWVPGLHGKMRKNRMFDVPVVLFMIYALGQCILSAL